MTADYKIEKDKLVITVDLKASQYETEKMFITASSGGFQVVGAYDNKPLKVNLVVGNSKKDVIK